MINLSLPNCMNIDSLFQFSIVRRRLAEKHFSRTNYKTFPILPLNKTKVKSLLESNDFLPWNFQSSSQSEINSKPQNIRIPLTFKRKMKSQWKWGIVYVNMKTFQNELQDLATRHQETRGNFCILFTRESSLPHLSAPSNKRMTLLDSSCVLKRFCSRELSATCPFNRMSLSI